MPETAWFETAPDWVCEILFPSTARDDRVVKMPIYARAGVGHIWLLDPELRTLEVYALESERWVLLEATGTSPGLPPAVRRRPDRLGGSLGLIYRGVSRRYSCDSLA